MISDNAPFRYGMAGELQRVLREADEDEWAFNLQGGDKIRLGWMPFQMADFVAIMTEVMRETNGVEFLEVGAGIGTKLTVAAHLFGLTTSGIEYNETLATVAFQKRRGPVCTADALSWPGNYGQYDIIWMYRVFRDAELQDQLEQRIYREMKPGAIFAGAALQNAPKEWNIVVDDWDMGNRGAWKKPLWRAADFIPRDTSANCTKARWRSAGTAGITCTSSAGTALRCAPTRKVSASMTAKITWDDYYLGIADAVAARADCTRRKVGAVVVRNNSIVATGYNGAPSGEPGCLTDGACPRGRHYLPGNGAMVCMCGGPWPCPDSVVPGSGYDSGKGACIAVHSEANALIRAGEKSRGAVLYCTDEPCDGCWRLIKGAGIARVRYYGGEWTAGVPENSMKLWTLLLGLDLTVKRWFSRNGNQTRS